ncbi:MAG: hypothetical protein V3U49_08190 [Nitrososphaerales archaeon]
MSSSSSKIEVVITSLSDMEKELDSIKVQANDAKREMISMARKEAILLKEKLVQDATKKMEQKVAVAVKENEKEAEKSISKAEDDIRVLKKKMDSRFDHAVDSVLKALIAE